MANEADKHRIAMQTRAREVAEDVVPTMKAVLNDLKSHNRVPHDTKIMMAAVAPDGTVVFQLSGDIWGELPPSHNPTEWILY